MTTLLLPPAPGRPVELAGPVLAFAVILLLALRAPWARLPAWTEALPALAFLVVIAYVRHTSGGTDAGVSALALLPVFWLALYGTRLQLVVAIGGLCALFALPLLLLHAPLYDVTDWRRGANGMLVAAIVGLVVQRLVGEVEARSAEAAAHASVLETVAAAVREMGSHDDPRQEICAAACAVSAASFSVLLESDGDDVLVATAAAGVELPTQGIAMGSEVSGAAVAFVTGERFFVPDAAVSAAVSRRLQRATGAVSLHYEPVSRAGVVAGVIVVGWRHRVDSLTASEVAGITLLALEAGAVLERAELLAHVRELSRTDPLTGLANRRAWDERLPEEVARAARSGDALAVAMLDFDRYKAFNVAWGHRAGDRLLKTAAAAWREHLRSVDVLARHGGDEFALLLPGCSSGDAHALLERLRASTPDGQACSIGVAQWDRSETAEQLVERADAALYEAKTAGRDRIRVSMAV